ncbi:hypothetical protein EV183_001830 [Coemansia sp. RSA 2336]|nr:hypothetical protein EV183_001830 [Coemansia sp. RSA 2336]
MASDSRVLKCAADVHPAALPRRPAPVRPACGKSIDVKVTHPASVPSLPRIPQPRPKL